MSGVRLVIHAPTPAALSRARANARNLLAVDPAARVEIVANAGAVRAVLEMPEAETDALTVLCRNSLAGQGLAVPAGAPATVDAGVLHIARRQHEGWAYMRA